MTRASELDPGCGKQIEGIGGREGGRGGQAWLKGQLFNLPPRLHLQNLARQAEKGNSGAVSRRAWEILV